MAGNRKCRETGGRTRRNTKTDIRGEDVCERKRVEKERRRKKLEANWLGLRESIVRPRARSHGGRKTI